MVHGNFHCDHKYDNAAIKDHDEDKNDKDDTKEKVPVPMTLSSEIMRG